MIYDSERSLELMRIGSGIPTAEFREDQEAAIQHIVEERGKLLVVQKTGWGKSFVYFIATKLLREAGSGPALLISPLLSLMRNQIAAAERMGVRAATINSDNTDDWEAVKQRVVGDKVDILLISPERLANEAFQEQVIEVIGARISLLVVDEAHCISDWGHDFRPDYCRIERIARTLPSNVPLLATTATANNRVLDDLVAILGPDIKVLRGDLNRPSLLLQTISLPGQAERLAWISERLGEISGSGIIYALTIRDVEMIARWLRAEGHEVRSYTGRSENREELETDLLENRVKALVATTALGMGFDKPDLAFVIHYQAPGSVVHYYQQVGRAGRQIDAAYGVLLSGSEDTEITDFFIRSAFPTREEVADVIGALESSPGGMTEAELLRTVNVRQNRLVQIIKLLSLESQAPLVKDGYRWQLTPAKLTEGFWERADRLTNLRYKEQEDMQTYASLDSGHMEFLIRALDGAPGEILLPKLSALLVEIKDDTVKRAIEFLQRTDIPIPPRKRRPNGRNIPSHLWAEPGKALCYWGDAGWGEQIRSGKYRDKRFSDELVAVSAQLIRRWNPQPDPRWVACIPSIRRPNLVPDFAMRLAAELNLPFCPVLAKSEDRREQKTMVNSYQQSRNVEDSLRITRSLPDAPVLLVDDMVDSGWTFTVASELLKEAGCPAVIPFGLSDTGTRQG